MAKSEVVPANNPQGLPMNAISIKRLAISAVMLCLAGSASAQFVWLDENGSKQFSDMPPPSNVPKSRILKSPGFTARSAPVATEGSDNAADASKPNVPMTTAEKNMDYKKRKLEQAAKDKKAAEKQAIEAENEKNCERTRSYTESLASGQRIAQNQPNGERGYMSDEQRAKELREAQKQLSECKK